MEETETVRLVKRMYVKRKMESRRPKKSWEDLIESDMCWASVSEEEVGNSHGNSNGSTGLGCKTLNNWRKSEEEYPRRD